MEDNKHIYFLVGIKLPQDDPKIVEESMRELEGLVKTAGGIVAGSVIQNRKVIDATYYIGKGKLEEIDLLFDKTEDQKAAVVFNMSLSPSQSRNIEEILECRVITRTELILDIFAIHAQSKVAKLQIETAQLSYLLPRLMGQGASMSRSGGGIGTRGPGETKLETDKRKINDRILVLKKELKQLEHSSEEKRKSRQFVFKVAIAGYTNAGKSSLASRLVGDKLLIEDKLFSTVDTTTRQLKLGGIPAVLTDTVGFIRDIPHEIVESFKSTLAETAYADLVLHAVDASSEFYLDKIQTANDLMDEMDIKSPIQLVFNKIDLLDNEVLVNLKVKFPEAIFLSAKSEDGIDILKELLHKEAIKFLKKNGQEIPSWMNY
ncbi:MAG: GTPase HflX [Spirochaetota bacterium]|nr:GTPase HflX [Spirochaetota bacterium]